MKSVFTAIFAAFMALAINAPAFAASAKITEPVFQALKSTKSGNKLLTETLGLGASADLAATNALINGLSSTQTAAVMALINQFSTLAVGADGKVMTDQNTLNTLADSLFLVNNKAKTLAQVVQLNVQAPVRKKVEVVGESCNANAVMENVDSRVTQAEVMSAMAKGFISHGVCGKDVQSMAALPKSNLMVTGVYVLKAFERGEKITADTYARGLLFAQTGSDQGTAAQLAEARRAYESITKTCGYFQEAA